MIKVLESKGKNFIHLDIKGDLASCQDPATYAAIFQKAICDNYLIMDKENTLEDNSFYEKLDME